MKKPTNRPGCRDTAAATDASSPGTLAISADARDAVRVELLHPAIGERFRRAGVVPLKLLAQRADRVVAALVAATAS